MPKTIRPTKPRRKLRTEHEEQSIVISWVAIAASLQTDTVRKLALEWVHAIPNGFYRGFAARRKAKAEGVKAGILDLAVPAPELKSGVRNSGNYHGLYIEMKRRGETLRTGQGDFMAYLDLVHYRNALCFSWQCAAKLLVEHLDLDIYPEIFEGEDDSNYVAGLLGRAKEIEAKKSPPKSSKDNPLTQTKKRKARPRTRRPI
jgi:hypothetical protein